MYPISKKYILPFFLLLMACHKSISPVPIRPEHYNNLDFNQVFEAFWNGLNVNYPIWDVDSTNWDEVYRKYQPLFASQDMTDEKANQYFQEMMSHMQEGHLWIDRKFLDTLGNDDRFVYSPVRDRRPERSDHHDSIPELHFTETIPDKYLQDGYVTGTVPEDSMDQSKLEVNVVSGMLKAKPVLYLHISSFRIRELYEKKDSNPVKTAIQHYINQVATPPADVKGLIIDMRSNGGGNTTDLDFIVGRLAGERYVYGANRFKNGNGRLDYGPWVPAYVTPPAGSKAFTKPVIVLCDIFTGSMAEATTMAVMALPNGNGKAVGERTFGRTAGLFNNMDMNSGQFTFENGKTTVAFGSSAFRFKDGNRYEGIGVPPNVAAPYDKAAIQAGRDPQLEKALELIP